jgi:hypothetical protein
MGEKEGKISTFSCKPLTVDKVREIGVSIDMDTEKGEE